MSMER